MIAGAAIPKAPQELRNRGGQRKVECLACDAIYYASRAQLRNGTHPCRCGAGPMIPSSLEDCAELTPDLLPSHPLYAVEEERADRAVQRRSAFDGVRRTFQCSACLKVIRSPEALCSCGFQNSRSGGHYAEGAASCHEPRRMHERRRLADMMPATRAERQAQAMVPGLPF